MTKHGIEGLTKALAVELAPHGIRVNAVAPTFVETPLTKPYFDDAAFKAEVLGKIPLGRLGVPEDIAPAVVYLASDASLARHRHDAACRRRLDRPVSGIDGRADAPETLRGHPRYSRRRVLGCLPARAARRRGPLRCRCRAPPSRKILAGNPGRHDRCRGRRAARRHHRHRSRRRRRRWASSSGRRKRHSGHLRQCGGPAARERAHPLSLLYRRRRRQCRRARRPLPDREERRTARRLRRPLHVRPYLPQRPLVRLQAGL